MSGRMKLVALGIVLVISVSACAKTPDREPGASDPPPSGSFNRVDVYVPLFQKLAGAQGGSLFVNSDICRGAEDAMGGEEPPCDDRFTEAERAEIAQAFPDWKQVQFVTRYEEIPEGEQPIDHQGNAFVWVGPLDEHGSDAYWIGGGMTCGGLCGSGGTFVVRLEGGSWVSHGHAPGTGSWIS